MSIRNLPVDLVGWVLVVSILLQLAAVGIAVRQLWEVPNLRWAWGMFTAAFALMVFRQIFTLGNHLEGLPNGAAKVPLEGIGLLISALLLAGVTKIGPFFIQMARSQAELQESQRAMRILLKNLPGMAYRCQNEPQWTMEFVSEGCEALTGYRPEDLIGNRTISYAELIVPEYRQQVYDLVQRAIAANEPFQLVYRIRTARGEEKWVWEQGTAVRDAQGRVLALEGFITDITQRRQAEEILRKTHEELEKLVARRTAELQQANQDLTQFAYSVSHDLQEPLKMMSSYLQTLAKRIGEQLSSSERTLLDLSLQACQRLQRMIQDLLAYSRAGTRGAYFEPVDTNQIVDEVIQNLQARIEQTGAQITRDQLPEVTADATLLLEVFQNLLSNAIKFHAPHRAPRVHIFCQEKTDSWVFGVQDNGIGIEPENLDRIFIIFERLHPEEQYPGTGIGLAICKRIVERHGGRIWCQSTPGEGSTFYFSLPKRPADQNSSTARSL